MFKMRPKVDRIEFRLSECMTYTNYKTKKTIYEALTALINADIIARGYNEYTYFINPMVTFNGDRVSYIKTYIKKKQIENTVNMELTEDQNESFKRLAEKLK